MYEWLSNFKLYKVPKTFITKNPKYVKTKRKIKGLKYELGKDQSEVYYYNKKSYVRFANIMANLMFFNMKTISRLQLV